MMADQTINPVSPTNRTRDVLKKKRDDNNQNQPRQQDNNEDKKPEKKGIIDTYA